MLKNKFKIIALLMVIILAVSLPIVRAENETDPSTVTSEANNAMPVSEGQENGENPESATAQDASNATEENFKKGDVYLTGDEVVIDYIIDGNLFVIADKVTINSQIGGDAFVCANSVVVGEQGYIFSNLFAASKDVEIKGVVYDVYSVSNNITISGYIYRDIKVGCDNLNIFGTVGRNAFVSCSNISFTNPNNQSENAENAITSQGMINGNLEYSSKNQIEMPEGAVVGETKYSEIEKSNNLSSYLIELGAFVVTTIVIWLLLLWLAPKFTEKSSNLLAKKLLPVIGLGIITPIIFVVVAVALLFLGITANLSVLAMLLLALLAFISSSIFVIAINNVICKKMKIEKKSIVFGILIVSSVVLWLLGLIPIVGSIINIIAVILGFGIITSSLVLKDQVKDEA